MKENEDAIKEAYTLGTIDALKLWGEYYELGRETAEKLYK